MCKVYRKSKKRKSELNPKKQRMQMVIFTFTFTEVRDEKALHILAHNIAWGPSRIQGDLLEKGPHGFHSSFLHFMYLLCII